MIRKDSIASCKEFLLDNIATGFLSEHPVPLPQQKVDVSSYFSSSLDAGLIFALQGRNIIKSTCISHFPIQENSSKEQRHDRRGSSSLLSSSFQPSSIQVTRELFYFFIQSIFSLKKLIFCLQRDTKTLSPGNAPVQRDISSATSRERFSPKS